MFLRIAVDAVGRDRTLEELAEGSHIAKPRYPADPVLVGHEIMRLPIADPDRSEYNRCIQLLCASETGTEEAGPKVIRAKERNNFEYWPGVCRQQCCGRGGSRGWPYCDWAAARTSFFRVKTACSGTSVCYFETLSLLCWSSSEGTLSYVGLAAALAHFQLTVQSALTNMDQESAQNNAGGASRLCPVRMPCFQSMRSRAVVFAPGC